MKRSTLNKIVHDLLFEDVAYGIYDRPAYVGATDDDESDPEFEPTLTPDVPLKPTEQMANQLTGDRPPIEDEDYIPTSVADLSHAASSIAQLVPGDQIEYFYRQLHKVLDAATSQKNKKEAPDLEKDSSEEETPLDPKNEAMLREAGWDDDYGDSSSDAYGNQWDEEGMSEWDPAAEEMAQEQPSPEANQGAYSLEQIADEFGFSGAPGARQNIDKILGKMQYFATKLKKSDVSALQDRAVESFIEEMQKSNLIDPEDVVELQQSPGVVKGLDSFRFFFVSAFVLPAYQEIHRDARKNIEAEMLRMSVPEKMQQMILNQATGGSTRNPDAIAKKLEKVAMELKMSPEEKQKIAMSIKDGFSNLVKLSEPAEDLVQRSLAKYDSYAPGKKKSILSQALNATSEFQEEL